MGHRAYIIKETENNNWEYSYSHWGAARLKELKEKHYHSDQEIDLETIKELGNNLFQEGEKQGTRNKIKDILDFSDITIEAYYIETNKGEVYLGFTFVSGINGGIIAEINEFYDYQQAIDRYRTLRHHNTVDSEHGVEKEIITDKMKNYHNTNPRRRKHVKLLFEGNQEKKIDTIF